MDDRKMQAYKDSVKILEAAYSSDTGYTGDFAPEFAQKLYDKLLELQQDVYGANKQA